MGSRQLHFAVFGSCGFESDTLVEISGTGNSGKSLVLQQLVAHCLAPYNFGGRQWNVLLINLSHKINRESLVKSIKMELQAYSLGEEVAQNCSTEEQLAEIAAECVGRVRFLNCFSNDDVSTSLIDARYAIINDPGIQLVAMDTLSEFYWLDDLKLSKRMSMYRHYRLLLARLEKLCKDAIVCGMYTVESVFLDNRFGDNLPETCIKYHVRMQKIQGQILLNGLPLSFSNGLHLDTKTAEQEIT
ncbi:DNA repair protein XRCC2 [Drosophila santomea]|uniref:DNA repair protein XRCC2 n=1 Tax=Drosophila santomea TaxID=129105 RepID=UPI001953DE8F|nr:DNA repair protein XRCC2 [Drosophila santomea]